MEVAVSPFDRKDKDSAYKACQSIDGRTSLPRVSDSRKVEVGAGEFAFLTSSGVMLILLLQGTQENGGQHRRSLGSWMFLWSRVT